MTRLDLSHRVQVSRILIDDDLRAPRVTLSGVDVSFELTFRIPWTSFDFYTKALSQETYLILSELEIYE